MSCVCVVIGAYSINAASGLIQEDHLQLFHFVGRFLGKAIIEQQTLPVHLSLPLLKHILSVPVTFSDLELVDGTLFRV